MLTNILITTWLKAAAISIPAQLGAGPLRELLF